VNTGNCGDVPRATEEGNAPKGGARPGKVLLLREQRPETARTPGPAAGCNKPAGSCAEETVEVVRNGKDGTSLTIGIVRPKVGFGLPGVDARLSERRRGGSLMNPKRGVQLISSAFGHG